MRAALELCVVRIYSKNSKVIGAGCLVFQKHILTCAHVVADALSLPIKTSEMPDSLITLDFPCVAPKQYLKAKVVFWRPVNPGVEGEDIAGLELENPLPQMVQAGKLITSDDLWEHPFRVLGFPSGQPNGVSATGVLRGRVGNGWVQLEDVKQPGYRLEPGFSGAPIWDEKLQGVVGIAVAAEMNRAQAKVAFMIPASVLDKTWNQVNAISHELIEELEAKLLEYSSRAEILVFASYSRSGDIDQDCQEMLEVARSNLGLSDLDTANRENELLWLCQNSSQKIQGNIKNSEKYVVDFFVENCFEQYFEVEQSSISYILEQLRVALGLNEESAAITFSLSINKYGNKLLEQSDIAKAIIVFQEGLNYNHDNIVAHIGLGNAFLQKSQFLKAIKAFKNAEKITVKHNYFRKSKNIKRIKNLITKAKKMYCKHIFVKILRIIFPIPITVIFRDIILWMKK